MIKNNRYTIAVLDCKREEELLFHKIAKELNISIKLFPTTLSPENVVLPEHTLCVSISHGHTITEETIKRWSKRGVRYLSTRSIGYNHIDMNAAKKYNLIVENVPYSTGSVAEHALMQMLMLLRAAKPMQAHLPSGDYRLPKTPYKELGDLTVGLIGTGKIGERVASLLKGFGCKILCYDARENPNLKKAGIPYVDLTTLLEKSDMISLHIPLTEESYHFLNRETLAHCKKGAYLINTARGGLVDTEALIEALQEGHLNGAALDVFEGEEPYFYKDCRSESLPKTLQTLCEMPEVLLTPHSAFYTEHALQDMVRNSLTNCEAFLNNQKTCKIN